MFLSSLPKNFISDILIYIPGFRFLDIKAKQIQTHNMTQGFLQATGHSLVLSAIVLIVFIVPISISYVDILAHEINHIDAALEDFQLDAAVRHLDDHAQKLRDLKEEADALKIWAIVVICGVYFVCEGMHWYIKGKSPEFAHAPISCLGIGVTILLAILVSRISDKCDSASDKCSVDVDHNWLENDITIVISDEVGDWGSTTVVRYLSCLAVEEVQQFIEDGICYVLPTMMYAAIGLIAAGCVFIWVDGTQSLSRQTTTPGQKQGFSRGLYRLLY